MKKTLNRPLLPLKPGSGIGGLLNLVETHDAQSTPLHPSEIAWLNRAAERDVKERPKLRRALREAIEELESGMGGPNDATEDEVLLLGRLCLALGPKEFKRFQKTWSKTP